MASFFENLRAAFQNASAQTANNKENKFTGRRSTKEIAGTMKYADADEPISKNVTYTPFAWRKGRDGEKQRGLLIHDGKKVYGLEKEDGTSMTSKAVQKLLNELANDDESSFSDMMGTTGYSFIQADGTPTGDTDLTNYNLYGRQAEKVGRGSDSNFLRMLRASKNK